MTKIERKLHAIFLKFYSVLCDIDIDDKSNNLNNMKCHMCYKQSINKNNSNNKNYDNKILLFLKYYDVYHECLSLISSILINKNGNISLILKAIREIAHLRKKTTIIIK